MKTSEFIRELSTVPSRRHSSVHLDDVTYDQRIQGLVAYLKQPGVVSDTVDLIDYLEALSPSVHSLSFLFLLHFQIQHRQRRERRDIPEDLQPGGKLWKHASRFLRSFDPIQIRYVGHEWRQLVELVASAAQATSKPIVAVKVIKDALERLGPSGVFTSLHLTLVRLSLLSSTYSYVLPIVNKLPHRFPAGTEHINHETLLCSEHVSDAVFITDASGFSSKLNYRDHLQFFLYSAMIYMALKKWDQAVHCLNAVITSSTANSVSKIMVDAYKKWILATLLGHGRVPPASKMIAPHVTRVYQALARPYISLAEAFERGDAQKMSAEIDLGQPIWQADNNTGLVSQLRAAYDEFMIIKLGRTFSALTTADVLQRTSPCFISHSNLEDYIASLVLSDRLKATLSDSPGSESTTLLRFSSSTQSDAHREEYIRTRLVQGMSGLDTIAQGIAQTDHTLEVSIENIHSVAKSHRWNGNSDKSAAVGSVEAGTAGDVDEDLMGDTS
ncbi:signalosome subunit 3 [Aspergillus egyptiacus]|nr:signalosome subunit 3 [Aspergillus egyptiacus]